MIAVPLFVVFPSPMNHTALNLLKIEKGAML